MRRKGEKKNEVKWAVNQCEDLHVRSLIKIVNGKEVDGLLNAAIKNKNNTMQQHSIDSIFK